MTWLNPGRWLLYGALGLGVMGEVVHVFLLL